MTCIIGLATKGNVWMGADSCSSDSWQERQTLVPKLFSVGEFLIGYTDSFRMGNILQYHLSPEQIKGQESHQYMVQVFVEDVRNKLKDFGWASTKENVDTGGVFLVGFRGRLFTIDSDFQVNEMADGLDACGIGEHHALAAMLALSNKHPKERIRKSLEITSHFCRGVSAPFTISCLKKNGGVDIWK